MERDCYAQELISSRVIGVGEPSLDDNEAGIEADQWGNSTWSSGVHICFRGGIIKVRVILTIVIQFQLLLNWFLVALSQTIALTSSTDWTG